MIELKFTPAQDNWQEVTWLEDGKELKHTSYHPTQLDLLQADAAAMGTPLDAYADMLNEWVASYVTPPPDPIVVPQIVSMRQARRALNSIGLLQTIDSLIKTLSIDDQIEWEYATEVQRNYPLLKNIQQSAGLTDKQIDDLFILANTF